MLKFLPIFITVARYLIERATIENARQIVWKTRALDALKELQAFYDVYYRKDVTQ